MPRRKLVKKLSPEEEELNRKKKELRGLEDRFAELELTLNALRVDVGAFLFSVQAAVGERLLEEAILRRRLADALLAIAPDTKEYQTQAKRPEKMPRERNRNTMLSPVDLVRHPLPLNLKAPVRPARLTKSESCT